MKKSQRVHIRGIVDKELVHLVRRYHIVSSSPLFRSDRESVPQDQPKT